MQLYIRKRFSYLLFFSTILSVNLYAQLPEVNTRVLNDKQFKSNANEPLKLIIPFNREWWDMTAYAYINANVTNQGKETIRVEGHLNENRWVNSSVRLRPGEHKILQILIKRNDIRYDQYFQGMYGKPGGHIWLWGRQNISEIKSITFIREDKKPANLLIEKIIAGGTYIDPATEDKKENIYPFVDQYGQNKHADWPGKTFNDEQLKAAVNKEERELSAMPGPADRDEFGGFKAGPQLKATGRFRIEKYKGKWWFVDPEGYLFWSNGATCVGLNNAGTIITGREKFFSGLPPDNFQWSFVYKNDNNKVSFNHYLANLYIKYGADWNKKASENIQKRFKSWGLNSFGNWSDISVNQYGEKTPYFMAISPQWPKLDGENKKFPDVFNHAFITALNQAVTVATHNTKDDPFCVGYFIDNELDFHHLTKTIMLEENEAPSKKAFIAFLQNKYASINRLNAAWQANFESWNTMISLKQLPPSAEGDMKLFDLEIIDTYFSACKTSLKQAAPQTLYLGSRLDFHDYPDNQSDVDIIKIAAKYTDVVSFNRYRFIASDLLLPQGIDKPTIIGEFHFGALDRGMLHTGLRSVRNQQDRAEAYEDYVNGALRNPQIIGAHWFQYQPQPLTGRGDGENYQIGIIDICDNPYPEFIKALRKVGYQLYQTRLGNDKNL